MGEVVLDFDEWFKNQQRVEIEYWAVYNNEGAVLGVYPGNTVPSNLNKIQIESDIAERLRDGSAQLHSCYVDVIKKKFFATYEKEIDNVLHKVPYKEWSKLKYFDFYIEYYQKSKKIKLSLSEKFYGNKKTDSTFRSTLFNDSRIEILLLVTEYNDPNILYYPLSATLGELQGQSKIFKNIDLPEKFSVYTRRLFDSYILDIK
jgi:hypothetical protein